VCAGSAGRCGTALVLAIAIGVLGARSAAAADPNVTVTIVGTGTVSVAPLGIACPPTCTFAVPAGTSATLTATPGDGFVFLDWLDCPGSSGTTCVLSPQADTTVRAVFSAATTTTAATQTSASPPPPVQHRKPYHPPPPATTAAVVTAAAPQAVLAPPTTRPVTKPTHSIHPSAGGGADIESELRAAVAGLGHGHLAFNTPTRLGLHQTATIQLLLSPSQSVTQLERKLAQPGARAGAPVRFSPTMQAELKASDFEVTPLDDARKLIDPNAPTSWQWEISPKHTGLLHLTLSVTAFVTVGGQKTTYQVREFDRKLLIQVGLITEARDFLSGNWQWLWSTILVPVGAWALRRRRKTASPAGGDAVGQG